MGLRQLRDDEFSFIQQAVSSQEVRRILQGARGSQAAAAKRVEQLYLEKFSGLLRGETDSEYAARLAIDPKARRLEEETEEAQAQRLEKAPSRILGILKRGSDNFSRKRRRVDPQSDDHENDDDEGQDDGRIVKKGHKVPRASAGVSPNNAKTSAYREFQSSQHPSKPRMPRGKDTPKRDAMRQWNHGLKAAFDSLAPEEIERFREQAEAKLAEAASEEQLEVRHARMAEALPKDSRRAMHTWQKDTGWIGLCMLGGIDEHGEVAAVSWPTGRDRKGHTFEESLAEALRCTPRYIRVLFTKWISDIFDAPALEDDDAAKPMSPAAEVQPGSAMFECTDAQACVDQNATLPEANLGNGTHRPSNPTVCPRVPHAAIVEDCARSGGRPPVDDLSALSSGGCTARVPTLPPDPSFPPAGASDVDRAVSSFTRDLPQDHSNHEAQVMSTARRESLAATSPSSGATHGATDHVLSDKDKPSSPRAPIQKPSRNTGSHVRRAVTPVNDFASSDSDEFPGTIEGVSALLAKSKTGLVPKLTMDFGTTHKVIPEGTKKKDASKRTTTKRRGGTKRTVVKGGSAQDGVSGATQDMENASDSTKAVQPKVRKKTTARPAALQDASSASINQTAKNAPPKTQSTSEAEKKSRRRSNGSTMQAPADGVVDDEPTSKQRVQSKKGKNGRQPSVPAHPAQNEPPKLSRTGRQLVKTDRLLQRSPDMSAAKYAQSTSTKRKLAASETTVLDASKKRHRS